MVTRRKEILNFLSLMIASYLTICTFNKNLDINIGINFLLFYSIVDCFDNKPDMIIHHILVILLLSLEKIHNVDREDFVFLTMRLLKIEISTVPLQIMNLCNAVEKELDKIIDKNYRIVLESSIDETSIYDLCSVIDVLEFKTTKNLILSIRKIAQSIFVILFIYSRIIEIPLLYYNIEFWKITDKNNVSKEMAIILSLFYMLNIYWLYLIYLKLIKR